MTDAFLIVSSGLTVTAALLAWVSHCRHRSAFSEGYEIGLNKGFHIGREQARRKRGKDGRFLPNPWRVK